MTHRRLLFSIAIFLIGTLRLAQSAAPQIAGRVEDSQGSVVTGARVRVYFEGQSVPVETRSDGSGEFKLSVAQANSYLVSAETETLSLTQSLRLEAPARNLVLRLLPTALRASIQVTADAIPASVDDSGKAFDIIDREAMSRRNEIFFLETMRLTPGLQVQQIGGPGAAARIVTRGLRSADTSILIDGFRFRDVTATQGDAVALLPDMLVVNPDRFEACRGSESALYGTHAIGGVLNVVSDPGGGPFHGQLEFEGGGLGLLRGLAKAGGGQGRLQWTGAVTHLNVLNGVDGNDAYRNTGTQGFARFALSTKTSFSGRIFTTEAFSKYNTGPGAKPGPYPAGIIPGTFAYYTPQLDDPDARRATRSFMGMVGLDQEITKRLSLKVQYNRLYSNRYDANGPGGSGFQAQFRDYNQFQGSADTLAARLSYSWAKRQNLLFGYEFEREHFYNFGDDSNPNPAARTTRKIGVNQLSNAVYMQQQFRFFSNLIVNVGGRIQDFSLQQPDFFGGPALFAKGDLSSPPRAYTGDASIAYLIPRSGTKLRAHAGNAYRAPSLYERFGTSLFSGRYSVYGDPNLKPDRAISLDFGIDQYLLSNRIRASATYFYTRLQEVVGFGPVPREPYGRSSGYYNTGGGLARGVELSASLQPTRKLSLQSAYTYTSSIERKSIFLGGELPFQRVFPHTTSVTATYFFTKNLDASFDFFAASSYLVPFFVSSNGQFGSRAFRFSGPRKADIAARYRIPLNDRHTMELFTRLENINNQTYYEAGYQTPGFWGTGGVRWRF